MCWPMRSRWQRLSLLLVLVAVMASGCLRRCVPASLTQNCELVDLSKNSCDRVSFDPALPHELAEEARKRIEQRQTDHRPLQSLVLSGGGVYGAFGIGVLNGWTESGRRPEFDIVTGISTGALMATFAFLGPSHDAFLANNILEEGDRRDLMLRLPLVLVPFADAIYTSRPLARQIRRSFTPEILRDVAAAHAAGRRLYVGTTNLDERRLVIWDMGAIASQGTPESLELYRDVIRASSAVPVALPAVHIPVEINGRRFSEMHVDGGVSEELLFRPSMLAEQNRLAGHPGPWAPRGSLLHIIDNGKLYADTNCVKPRLLSILSATAATVLYGKTREEVRRIYTECLLTGMEFRLTSVPQDLPVGRDALRLTRDDRERLYEAGRTVGREAGVGPHWDLLPPNADSTDRGAPRTGARFHAIRN